MVTVFTKLTAYPDSIEKVVQEIGKVIPLTKEESGCIDYQVCQGVENPECFLGMKCLNPWKRFKSTRHPNILPIWFSLSMVHLLWNRK